MKTVLGLRVPQTLEGVCDPRQVALLVYDMQVGILSQIKNPEEITGQVFKVLGAARGAGVRVFFSRHLSLPKELMGMLVTDACGAGNEEAAKRSIENLKFAGDTILADTEEICAVLRQRVMERS
jgi:nicotinamidase-related amidase